MKVPVAVGVPLMLPSEAIVRPAGRSLDEKVYGPPVPPLPLNGGVESGTPSTAVITAQVAEGGALVVTLHVPVTVFSSVSPLKSVTWTWKDPVPTVVGVPVMLPVLGFRVSPSGNCVPLISANV